MHLNSRSMNDLPLLILRRWLSLNLVSHWDHCLFLPSAVAAWRHYMHSLELSLIFGIFSQRLNMFKCRSVQCAQCKCFRLLQVASGCVRLRQVASGCSRLLQVETLCHPCPVACQAASCLRLSVSTSCARSWACRVAWRNGRPKSAKQANRTFWHSTHIYIDIHWHLYCAYIYTYNVHPGLINPPL